MHYHYLIRLIAIILFSAKIYKNKTLYTYEISILLRGALAILVVFKIV